MNAVTDNRAVDLIARWGELLFGYPIALLVLVFLPLVALAALKKIYPDRMMFWAFSVPCLLSLPLLFEIDMVPSILAVDAAIVAMGLWDLLSLAKKSQFITTRSCNRIASLRKDHAVAISVENQGASAVRIDVRDDLPQEFQATRSEFAARLDARSRVTFRYHFRAQRRGAFRLECVYLQIHSRFGFWKAFQRHETESTVHVYPDMQQLSKYAILARTNRLSLIGVRRTRRVGQDNEFERLRDFTRDDNYKHIDWRSTARRSKLTVKDFQTSQSQRLVFLVDCGRMMTNESEGLSLLDHALNATLMLSYVALRQGDSVGMITFSDRVHSFVPPRGGMGQMNHLLHASFDRFPQLVESRYDRAFLHLASHFHKRSLVVLITNVIDEVNSNQIHRYLSTLVGRHLPLGVLLRDHRLFNAAKEDAGGQKRLFRRAAAAEILSWRCQVLTDLEHQGVLAIDAFPEDMTAPLVNRYLEIKARHLL